MAVKLLPRFYSSRQCHEIRPVNLRRVHHTRQLVNLVLVAMLLCLTSVPAMAAGGGLWGGDLSSSRCGNQYSRSTIMATLWHAPRLFINLVLVAAAAVGK